MYILWIGYLYVILMFGIGTGSVLQGSFIILFMGVLPTVLLGELMRRRRLRKHLDAVEKAEREARQQAKIDKQEN